MFSTSKSIYFLPKKRKRKTSRGMRRRLRRQRCLVYGIYDQVTDELVYIGQTRQTLKNRQRYYLKAIEAKKRQNIKLSAIENWLNRSSFVFKPIDAHATWDVSEIVYIERARQAGLRILNVLRGGVDTPLANSALNKHPSNWGSLS